MGGKDHRATSGVPGELVEDASSEPLPLVGRQHVQLGQLERVGHPPLADLRTERLDDDVVPPLAAPAEVAVAERHRLRAGVIVESDDRDEAAPRQMRVHDLAPLDDHFRAPLHRGAVDVRRKLDVSGELVSAEYFDACAHVAPTSAAMPAVSLTSSS